MELQNRLGVEDDKATCPNCKYSWVATKTVSGIREFLKRNFDDGAGLYKRMHSLRIELMHGKARFDQVASETTELAPKTGNALIAAILYLLSIDPPWTFPSHTLTNASPFRVLVKAKILSGKIEDAFYDHEDPHFKAEHALVEFSQERQGGGQTKMKVTTRTTAVIGAKAQFRVYGWGMQGEGKGDLSIDSVSK